MHLLHISDWVKKNDCDFSVFVHETLTKECCINILGV